MKTERRLKGSGTLFKRPNGYYVYQFIDIDGKTKTKTLRDSDGKPITLKSEAKKYAASIRHDVDTMRQLSYLGLDPAYFWVRERDTSIHNHYHLALWLNGSKIQHPQRAVEVICRLWERYVGLTGCVHYANAYEYAVMLRRGTEEHWDSFLRAFETFSYFAKLYSKETDLQLNCRRYGYSQPKFVKQYAIFKDWEIPLIYRSKSH